MKIRIVNLRVRSFLVLLQFVVWILCWNHVHSQLHHFFGRNHLFCWSGRFLSWKIQFLSWLGWRGGLGALTGALTATNRVACLGAHVWPGPRHDCVLTKTRFRTLCLDGCKICWISRKNWRNSTPCHGFIDAPPRSGLVSWAAFSAAAAPAGAAPNVAGNPV